MSLHSHTHRRAVAHLIFTNSGSVHLPPAVLSNQRCLFTSFDRVHKLHDVNCAFSGLSSAVIIFNFRFPDKYDPTVISLSSLSSVVFPVFYPSAGALLLYNLTNSLTWNI